MENVLRPSFDLIDQHIASLSPIFKTKQYLLILIRGLPGMGKTTCSNRLISFFLQNYNLVVQFHEADQYFQNYDERNEYVRINEEVPTAHFCCNLNVATEMRYERPVVIVSNTFIYKKEIDLYKDLASQFGYHVVIFDMYEFYKRANIGNEFRFNFHLVEHCRESNLHGVDEVALQRMMDNYHIIGVPMS